MTSKKRKRGGKPGIHPRNRYADNPPDFSLLASLYPSFAPFVFYSRDGHGRPRIDWTDFNATRELTRVLLHHDHSLNWWIPDGQLCPTVPNRSNYIHWIEDLLASDIIEKNNANGDKVRGFDIGTGANGIYPLLGASLLGWSFVGSDVTDVAVEWAETNVKSNPHISELIEIRKVCVGGHHDGCRTKDNRQRNEDIVDLALPERENLDKSAVMKCEERLGLQALGNSSKEEDVNATRDEDYAKEADVNETRVQQSAKEADVNETGDDETKSGPSTPFDEHLHVNKCYHGPPILLGVVKEGEKFDFCMCNPPFFETMEEAGLNPRTACGGTPEEMICSGGERAFISRIIEDSVALKQSFRWYTSMVGKKSNLKFLMSKLREVGVTIVKTTEFVQGQTSRWGLGWSFMPTAKKLLPSHVVEKSNLSFMLERLQHQASAFSVLQSVESFFNRFGANCKSNLSLFTIDVSASTDCCDAILKTDVTKLDEGSSSLHVAEASSGSSCSHNPMTSFRISVFQQIPGTLLVRGSLQQRDSLLSGAFTCVFQRLEEFLKHKFCVERAFVTHVNQIQRK